MYDCKPTICQKPSFAAGELREGCGNEGFNGLPCFQIRNSGAGQGAGTRDPFPCIPGPSRLLWSSNGSHGLSKHECCSSAQRPWPSQVSLFVYSSHMPLYGTVCLVEYGTMWRHGSSPTKLSCGGVAGTLREQGIWPPVHCFSKLVDWGFAAKPFGRQARDRRQFKNHGVSVAGTNFLCKTMCFLLREQKGLPATVQKPWFFCCGKKWVF